MNHLANPTGISVVITTFNRPYAVLGLIRQVLGQTNPGVPVEILVVVDGDSSQTIPVLKSLTAASRWPVRFFDSGLADTFGAALCRNIGIRFAQYSRLVFLDDDVSIQPTHLIRYRLAPDCLGMGPVNSLVFDNTTTQLVADERRSLFDGAMREILDIKPYLGYLWGANFSIAHRYAAAIGGFDTEFIGEGQEDMDFGARAMGFMQRFAVVPSAAVVHHGLAHNQTTNGQKPDSRIALAEERYRQRKSHIVNGGLAYWTSDMWKAFCR